MTIVTKPCASKGILRTGVMLSCLVLLTGSAFAQSAKNAVLVSSVNLLDDTGNADWTTILGNEVNPFAADAVSLRTSNQKDLIFRVALECGLYTKTLARSKGGTKDTSSAEAAVQVQVVLDPGTASERIAEPGPVTFCERQQTLSATLQGIIENLACFPEGVFDPDAEGCELTAEEIELTLRTLTANAFVFALGDVGSGVHNVIVQADIKSMTAVEDGEAAATALIGKGAVEVEEVRLVKGSTIVLD